jgi:RimJ/RimL family protein N-acetyltransferase
MSQPTITLRSVIKNDLEIFFIQQQDPVGNQMAAFTVKDPTDREAFDKRWQRILQDPNNVVQTILYNQSIAGSVLRYQSELGPEVSYWLGREFWGKGIATKALALFLEAQTERPLFARVATDNLTSRRVLERCGFEVIAKERSFAEARQAEIDEMVLRHL